MAEPMRAPRIAVGGVPARGEFGPGVGRATRANSSTGSAPRRRRAGARA